MSTVDRLEKSAAAPDEWDLHHDYHDSLLYHGGTGADGANNVHTQEAKNAPLFSVDVARSLTARIGTNPFPQYALLGKIEKTYKPKEQRNEAHEEDLEEQRNRYPGPEDRSVGKKADRRLFVNMNAPFSAFLCGSQGSGKSHTLSCMLEGALKDSRAGKLVQPMAGLVFHFDKASRSAGRQPCEAAYLCSEGIPVRVLVPLSSAWKAEELYTNLPGLPAGAKKPVVCPLLLLEEHLDVTSIMTLMKIDPGKGGTQLYMETVYDILRQLSMEAKAATKFDHEAFLERIKKYKLLDGQSGPLRQRLDLLERFLAKCAGTLPGWLEAHEKQKVMNIFSFAPGTLTIIDLCDPWTNEGAACALFDICLSLFKDLGPKTGKMVALDEAHKFMTSTDESSAFTDSLLKIIREQRHSGMRVIIATQEPTISPKLLDLCSMTIVHRFTSPDWLQTLKARLAGVATPGDEDAKGNVKEIFNTIVHLAVGEALLFSPSAMLEAAPAGPSLSSGPLKLQKLGLSYVKIRVRKRLTADGGRSVMAV
ncbi:MAG: hypothetical protein LQ344_002698 [Seirophora lacunosa]|nr:MAG: hypothetical protein LQ344_002698 [Seirophora lacunosa]